MSSRMSPEIEGHLPLFLNDMNVRLRQVREDRKALWLSLRSTCHFFKATDACLAVLPAGGGLAKLIFSIPRGGSWDLDLLTAFLRRQKPPIPKHILLAPLNRAGRLWAVLGLRLQQGEFRRNAANALYRIAREVSDSIQHMDWERIVDVRSRIDRKIMEELRPQDLFYQILHGLRSLTRYDHSSALLICGEGGGALELVAEQVAWLKGKSLQIGRRMALAEPLWNLMREGTVYGFDRKGDRWLEWPGQKAIPLAELLDYNRPQEKSGSVLREAAMLCAPLATRDGVLGVLKVAARHAGTFGTYEAELLQRFMPLAAVAIQNSQRTVTLEAKMLAAERKHAIADLARGVSHDVNNALGAVLPLVQQMLADVRSGRADPDVLAEDLQQIEQSLQTCRRIFGGMLTLARGAAHRVGQGDVHRAIECTLAILEDSLKRQGVRLSVDFPKVLPLISGGQGDLEQLFLNLLANARDAMPAGGLLSVRALRSEDKMEVVIQDTGCGIAPEHLSQIEEPFFTTKHDGRGLGLSICRSIIWEMQGDLKISSQQGVGTEVRVLLPMLETAAAGVGR
jgi:two-component system, NtrC family, sensor kinase